MERKQAFFESYLKQLFPEPEKIIYVNGSMYYPIGRVYVLKLALNVRDKTIYGFNFELLHRANGSTDMNYFSFENDLGLNQYSLENNRWRGQAASTLANIVFENQLKPIISKYVRLWAML